ncbi:LOW QUALITY PROTEIN: hypothetical protein CFOL_v3_05887, partial [Cephalotus follicularis]
PGLALITTSQGKFSNGFNLNWAQVADSTEARHCFHHMGNSLKRVMAELISLPMPTVVVASFIHNYLLMRNDRGVLYMSEVDIGLTLPHYFVALVAAKIGASTRQDVLLRGLKVKRREVVKMRIVDVAHYSPDMLQEASVHIGE